MPESNDPKARLRSAIERHARELGFLRCGFAPVPARASTLESYDAWLAEGRHGEMRYLAEQRDVRASAGNLMESARTAVVCLAYYGGTSDELDSMRVARYAQGDDYHDVLQDRLTQLSAFIEAETGAAVESRGAPDLLPMLERDLARAAGLGWLAKNTMLIDEEVGSFHFIATLLVDVDLDADTAPPHPDRCGTCRACIDVCPTQAIAAPGLLDARRCISYLTIELRGPIPRALRPAIGAHLFGCDLCQNVCPWNGKAGSIPQDFVPRQIWGELTPASILRMDHDTYAETFRGSAIKRARYDGLLRNAAVVLGNTATDDAAEVLVEQLWESDVPLVRGHIAWALSHIEWAGARSALENRSVIEQDPYVHEEIRWALSNLERP